MFKKIPYVLSLLIQNSDSGSAIDVLQFHKKLLMEEKYEVGFVLFSALDGEKTKNHLNGD